MLFDANICHGSAPNMSPFDRAVAIVTYNSVDNLPVRVTQPRPEFLASRDYEPLQSLDEDAILTNDLTVETDSRLRNQAAAPST